VPRYYGSFLVRCWRLGSGERRIDIEHIASGARVRVTSIAAALKWIGGQVGDPLIARPSGAGARDARLGGGGWEDPEGHTQTE
jgi:hypothetical protein